MIPSGRAGTTALPDLRVVCSYLAEIGFSTLLDPVAPRRALG